MITYENELTAEEYVAFRDAVGWVKLSLPQAQRGIDGSTYIVTAREGEKAIGMARVLFDFGYTAYIADVIVLPEYQGMGIGRQMVEHLIEFVRQNSTEGEFLHIILGAAKGKEGFYEKLGFTRRDGEQLGLAMSMMINKK